MASRQGFFQCLYRYSTGHPQFQGQLLSSTAIHNNWYELIVYTKEISWLEGPMNPLLKSSLLLNTYITVYTHLFSMEKFQGLTILKIRYIRSQIWKEWEGHETFMVLNGVFNFLNYFWNKHTRLSLLHKSLIHFAFLLKTEKKSPQCKGKNWRSAVT